MITQFTQLEVTLSDLLSSLYMSNEKIKVFDKSTLSDIDIITTEIARRIL